MDTRLDTLCTGSRPCPGDAAPTTVHHLVQSGTDALNLIFGERLDSLVVQVYEKFKKICFLFYHIQLVSMSYVRDVSSVKLIHLFHGHKQHTTIHQQVSEGRGWDQPFAYARHTLFLTYSFNTLTTG
jgi:hypothetical protein